LILSDLLAQIISTCKIPYPPSPVNRKVPETVEFPGLLTVLIFRSALAELRSAAGEAPCGPLRGAIEMGRPPIKNGQLRRTVRIRLGF